MCSLGSCCSLCVLLNLCSLYPFGFDLIVVRVVLMVPRAIGVLVVPTVSSVIVVLAVPIPLIVRVGTVVFVVPTLHT